MNFFKKVSNELIQSFQLEKKKIAIVGGSKDLIFHNYGNIIDDHDFIIRFNRAPVENYEKYVGSRTDLRVMSELFFLNNSQNYENKKINFNYLSDNINYSNIMVLHLSDVSYLKKKNYFSKTNNFLYLNSSINHKLKFHLISKFNYLKKFKFYFHNSDLTSGALILSLLVYFNIKPSVFGFDFFKTKNNYKMYYVNYTKEKPIHNFSAETQLLGVIKSNNLANFY